MALEATYLLPLRLVLLDEMMSDLTTLVDGYLNTYREGSADRLGGMEVGTHSVALFSRLLLSHGGVTVIPTLHSCTRFFSADLMINILEGLNAAT